MELCEDCIGVALLELIAQFEQRFDEDRRTMKATLLRLLPSAMLSCRRFSEKHM